MDFGLGREHLTLSLEENLEFEHLTEVFERVEEHLLDLSGTPDSYAG